MMFLYNKNGEKVGEIYCDEIEEPIEPEVGNVTTTREKLGKIFYDATEEALDEFYKAFDGYARKFRIDAEVNENFFLAQIVAETGYALISVRENLNYSESALKSTFSRYRNNPDWANRDGRNDQHSADQVMIGNVAYADRIGNGDIDSGDGYTFRGGGFFQTTGRYNYQVIADGINNVTDGSYSAEDVADNITHQKMGVIGAMAFWYDNECYKCTDIDCVTKKINQYTDTYDKRKEIYQWIATL